MLAAARDRPRSAVLSEAPTPKGRRRQADLLAAANQVFTEKGYFETRVEDIAVLAKVSRATFYTYFDSKDEILAVLVHGLVDELFDASAAPIEPQASPYMTLKATIRQLMYAYRDRAPLIRILEQAVAFSDDFVAIRTEIRNRFGERLIPALRSHSDASKPLDPELAAYALGGMVDDFARGCYILNQLVDEEAAIETLARIWSRSVGLPPEYY